MRNLTMRRVTMKNILMVAILMSSAGSVLQAADAKTGEGVYLKHCGTCHGSNGAAPPNVAKFQNGRITDLRSAKVQSMSDADLTKIINKGTPGMKGDATVSGKDMEDLLAFMRSLKV